MSTQAGDNIRVCVCLLCYKPNDIWLNFLTKFTKYHIYIVIDDNSKDYKKDYSNFSNIHIIQIDNNVCRAHGFINMNYIIKKDITAWEKAMYYFSSVNTCYNKMWFFEDDVFFYDEESLLQIDSKYKNSDLLSREFNNTYIGGLRNFWLWDKINISFEPPYYRSMTCCIRISPELLSKLKNYAQKYKTLFFLEALFPTICMKYNLQHNTPDEFKNILYRKVYNDDNINKIDLYHPVKEIAKHTYYRDMLNKQ